MNIIAVVVFSFHAPLLGRAFTLNWQVLQWWFISKALIPIIISVNINRLMIMYFWSYTAYTQMKVYHSLCISVLAHYSNTCAYLAIIQDIQRPALIGKGRTSP